MSSPSDEESAFVDAIDHMDVDDPGYPARVAARQAALVPTPGQVPALARAASVPHASHVLCAAVAPGATHVFSGALDGFVRKYDVRATVTGSSRVHDVARGPAVLAGYWENETAAEADTAFGTKLRGGACAPVRALAVQREELWALSLAVDSLNLFTVRHDMGRIRHVFRSQGADGRALRGMSGLRPDERGVLSGGNSPAGNGPSVAVAEWDLDTGARAGEWEIALGAARGSARGVRGASTKDTSSPSTRNGTRSSSATRSTRRTADVSAVAEASTGTGVPPPAAPLTLAYNTPHTFLVADGAAAVVDTRIASADAVVLRWPAADAGGDSPAPGGTGAWLSDTDVALATADTVTVYSSAQPDAPLKSVSIPSAATAIAPIPGCDALLIGSEDGLRIWDVAESTLRTVRHMGAVTALAVDPARQFAFAATGDNLDVYDVLSR